MILEQQVTRTNMEIIKEGTWCEEDRGMLIGLHQTAGIGWKTITALFTFFEGQLHLLLDKSYCNGLKLPVDDRKAQLIAKVTAEDIAMHIARYQQLDAHIITIYDEQYPTLLRETHRAPWVIYGKGNIDLLHKKALAIVGTRTPTTYGRRMAERFASELAELNWCVVSGLARGIDSIAHVSALQHQGKTIAVLGTGLNVVYPREHADLYELLGEQGLLLTEYPLDTPPKPGHFPLRNRIIAGMSYGTLVIEAAERSGTLITAMIAFEENREVFALPGPISSPKSAGTLEMIQKNQAKLIMKVEDIVEEFDYVSHSASDGHSEVTLSVKPLSAEEHQVLSLMSFEPITFDKILVQSQLNFGHLHSVLLSLTINSHIEQLPGGAYVKVQ